MQFLEHVNVDQGKDEFEGFITCSPTILRYILHSLIILTYMQEIAL